MNEASMVREAAQKQAARIAELEDKHWSECAQIARYDDDQNKRDTVIRSLLHTIEEQKAEIAALKRPLKKLVEVGYCHNFQRERKDLVDWIYAITAIQRTVNAQFDNSEVPHGSD